MATGGPISFNRHKKALDKETAVSETNSPTLLPASGNVRIYRDDGRNLQVRLDGQTTWLTQDDIAELFQASPQTIATHIKSIYHEGEVDQGSTARRFLRVRTKNGREVRRAVLHYNLDMVLAIGYRVRSGPGTQFRQWATAHLRDLLVKGFILDEDRMKAGRATGQDYFDELLERLHDIRASERLFYQKITDILATSIDYDPNSEVTRDFFRAVQNKMHWAAHGHTAAEIVRERADAGKENVGLTTWKNAPGGAVSKADVAVAKNYLTEEEITELNRIVSMYLDYAEDLARRHRPMHMADWIAKLDSFLRFHERHVLTDEGTVRPEEAEEYARHQYNEHRQRGLETQTQEPASDFDKIMKESGRSHGRIGEGRSPERRNTSQRRRKWKNGKK